jgi:hypothetical protein
MTPDEALRYFSEWKAAYQAAFGENARALPAFVDLARFCHARETCVIRGDRDLSLVMEGRRQVYLRVMNFIELTPEELVVLHTRRLEGESHVEEARSQ